MLLGYKILVHLPILSRLHANEILFNWDWEILERLIDQSF